MNMPFLFIGGKDKMIIKKAEYLISETDYSKLSYSDFKEFVFMGRSNVGKSSLINALTNRKKLAYTSSKPGKTTTLNFYNINDEYLFVDVPGYGYAKHEISDRLAYGKMIETYLQQSKHLQCCFLIIDSRHLPTQDDILMYNYLKHLNKKVIICATKVDKLSRNDMQKSVKNILDTFNHLERDAIYLVSSLTKQGIPEIQDVITSF
jgi:ribosome biogenesis GTP-binding protein ysxC